MWVVPQGMARMSPLFRGSRRPSNNVHRTFVVDKSLASQKSSTNERRSFGRQTEPVGLSQSRRSVSSSDIGRGVCGRRRSFVPDGMFAECRAMVAMAMMWGRGRWRWRGRKYGVWHGPGHGFVAIAIGVVALFHERLQPETQAIARQDRVHGKL